LNTALELEPDDIPAGACGNAVNLDASSCDRGPVLPAGLDENGSASFAKDVSACLHADAKRRQLMTAVTDRRAPKCFLWSSG
jgi:hypothetical protein